MATLHIADQVAEMALSPDGTLLAIGGRDSHSILVYNMETSEQIYEPLQAGKYILSVTFSPDGQFIACTSRDYVYVWDTATGRSIFPTGNHGEYAYDVTFSSDSQLVISACFEYAIRVWYASTGQPTAESPVHTAGKVVCVSTSSDGIHLAAGYTKGDVEVYDMKTWQRQFILPGDATSRIDPKVLFTPDSQRIFVAHGHLFRVWDASTRSRLNVFFNREPESLFKSFAFSPDGRQLALATHEAIEIWDAVTGDLYSRTPHGQQGLKFHVAWLPNGRQVLSGSEGECNVRLWNIRGSGEQAKLLGINPGTTSIMNLADVVSSLRLRGCPDMTNQLDSTTGSEYPILSGGFGDIYRCKLRNGTEVAVKTIRLHGGLSHQDDKHLKHVTQELYTWSKCNHTNVQPLLGLAIFRGQIGMVAEWELNGSVPEYLERHPGVDRCIMSIQITEGLSYLHASGIVHGDLKGSNVLVSIDGIPRLADFGNAKLQEYTLKFTKTSTKEIMSSRWAAPELFEGGLCTFESDIYALGMTILELITGTVPWSGKTERYIMFAITIRKEHPERPELYIPTYSEHGDMLWSLLRWCWEYDPEQRPNAEQVKTKIKDITQNGLRSVEVEMNDVEMN
ncbi:Vegetative incompatibility protein HET-E-1 [Ceratobasidium sp. AG-Ba]|nr:Vegetative incompatibility protein HET-E-1 [Ceratobasidium sp. AG-Ba]